MRNFALAFVALVTLATSALVSGNTSPASAESRCVDRGLNGHCNHRAIVKLVDPVNTRLIPAQDGYPACVRPKTEPFNCWQPAGGQVLPPANFAPAPQSQSAYPTREELAAAARTAGELMGLVRQFAREYDAADEAAAQEAQPPAAGAPPAIAPPATAPAK